MLSNNIVIPQQSRSIEKRNKIIEAAFSLFSEKGYYNTNTAEIAKKAGVSTGIVYRYFMDKKSIYLEVYQARSVEFYDILISKMGTIKSVSDFNSFLSDCIDYVISNHGSAKSVHEEFAAMAHYDPEIAEIFENIKEKAIIQIANMLEQLNFNTNHIHEKVHPIIELIESYCHEILYSKEENKDYNYLKQIIIDTCIFLLMR